MLNCKRSDIEIIGEILDLSKEGAQKADIYYEANLSYKQLGNYLQALIKEGLLEEKQNNNNSHKIFNTTQRGIDLLKNINKISNFLK